MKFDEWLSEQVRTEFDDYVTEPSQEELALFRERINYKPDANLFASNWLKVAIMLVSLGFVYVFISRFRVEYQSPVTGIVSPQKSMVTPNLQSLTEMITPPQEAETPSNQLVKPKTDDAKSANSATPETSLPSPNSSQKLTKQSISLDKNINTPLFTDGIPIALLPDSISIIPPVNSKSMLEFATPSESLVLLSTFDEKSNVNALPVVTSVSTKVNKQFDIRVGSMVAFSENELLNGNGYSAGAVHYWNVSSSLWLGTGGLLAKNDFTSQENLGFNPSLLADIGTQSSQNPVSIYDEQRFSTVALEIPILAQWDFSAHQKKGWVVGVGISSLVYLKQEFHEKGQVVSSELVTTTSGETNYNVSSSPFESDETIKPFNQNDWLGLLQFSTAYRFSSRWETEAFFKLPVSGLTARKLDFTYTGFNLRYNLFQK